MTWVNRLYVIFLGIILSLTVGFGISAFYPQPIRPQYPSTPSVVTVPQSCYDLTTGSSLECKRLIEEQQQFQVNEAARQNQYNKDLQRYTAQEGGYNRTTIFFGVAIGALFAIGGLLLLKQSMLVAKGLLLGGVLTAIFTRFLVSVASLGASVGSTGGVSTIAYIEFFILIVLSVAVVYVGLSTLREGILHTSPQPTNIS